MSEFGISIDVNAPPERVWSVMRDIERWPEWTASVTRVERLDDGPLTIGSRARIRQPKLLPAVWQITELEEGRGFEWVTTSPGVRVTGRHGVEPVPGGTRATLSLQFSGAFGGIVAWLTRGLNEKYLTIEANGLKTRSEATTS